MKSFLFRTAMAIGASLLAISPPWAVERALLANPGAATLAAASASDRVLTDKMARLRTIAKDKASVRLIVGVRAAFAPEGKLAQAEAVLQRVDIGNAQAAVLNRLALAHGEKKGAARFETIPFMALEASVDEFDTLASDSNVLSIEEDALDAATLAQSSPLIGATGAWVGGHDGSGQVIAILDSGVDKTHPFLTGKVVSEACYSTNDATNNASTVCPDASSNSTASGSGVDCGAISGCEHGTHVAGIVAGSGASFSGVARGAKLIAIQVFSRFNSTAICGSAAPCVRTYTSDQIKGLERVLELGATYSIAAVNMSLGGGRYYNQSTCDSEQSSRKAAIDNLRAAGIATVIASGNDGYTDSMNAPGCVSSAVSVGATWDAAGLSINCEASSTANKVACYSDSVSFLNLLAPGSAINSSVPGGGYAVEHGTSMATPQVAGAWAVLKQAVPGLSVSSALNALTSTGVPVTDYRNGIVKPRINLVAALALVAPPATYTLTVSSSGASGVSIGSSTGHGGTTNYSKAGIAAGTGVTLTAPSAAGGAMFNSWSGCNAASGVICSVTMNASNSVTANYSAAQQSQTIIFGTAPTVSVGGTVNVSATASSGLTVAFTSTTTGVCTVSSSGTVTGVAAGTCIVAANQAGNDSYSAAPQVTQSINVASSGNPSSTTLLSDGFEVASGWQYTDDTAAVWSFMGSGRYPSTTPHGGSLMAKFNSYSALSGSESRLFRSTGFAIPSNATLVVATFWMYHDTGYSTKDDRIQFQVSTDGAAWNNVGAILHRYNGTTGWAQVSVDLAGYKGQSNVQVGFLGSSAYGNNIYLDDLVVSAQSSALTSQAITFGTAPTLSVGGTGIVNATASSNLPVTFTSTTTGICTVSGSMVTGVAAGTCTVAANQAGSSSFSAAPQVTQSFSIVSSAGATWVWNVQNSNSTATLSGITFGGGKFVAVGVGGAIVSSPDGVSWTPQNSGTVNNLGPIAYGNGIYLATNGTGGLLSSSDAINWTRRSITWLGYYNDYYSPNSMAFGNGRFVVVGGGRAIHSSPDGVNWNYVGTGGVDEGYGIFSGWPPSWNSVTFGNGRFVAVGDRGTITTSVDGTHWTTQSNGADIGTSLYSVVYGSSAGFIATGTYSTALSSTDGVTWTLQSHDSNAAYFSSGCYGGGYYIFSFIWGAMVVTQDGVTYRNNIAGLPKGDYNAAAYGNGTFVIVGKNGFISSGKAPAASGTFALSVSATGTGSGSITGNGISCASSAGTTSGSCSANFASGAAVMLTATPSAGSAFAGWSGACSGTSTTCAVSMDAAKSVIASFDKGLPGQTITFGAAPTVALGGTGVLSATASSGLPVTFTSTTTGVCTVSGNTVRVLAVGTCTVAANQAGNSSYSPAPQVTQSLYITTGLYTQTVEKLYVAYFGRPGNALGMAYWGGELEAGNGSNAILQNIFTAFNLSAEYIALHAGQTTDQLVSSLYQNLFGRDADPAGISYWVQQIQSGAVTLDRVAYTLVVAAYDKPGGNQDLTVLNNKVAVATTFTAHVDTAEEIARYKGTPAYDSARAFLSTVKTAVPSDAVIDAAILSLP